VIPFDTGRKAAPEAWITMTEIIRKTESQRETQSSLYEEAEGFLNDVISKSQEHFGADSLEVGRPASILNIQYPPR
jgi:hypothetical protein